MLPWETQLGDIGETEIKSRLQRFSTVTKIERDVGIDFYCDLIVNGVPSIPFYIQAKSSQHLDSQCGCSIKKSTIKYWLMKPHPVYIIFYDEQKDICYWKSIEEDRYVLIEKFFKNESKTVYIALKPSNILYKNGNNQTFIRQLEKDYHSLLLFRGIPKFMGGGYIKTVPEAPRTLDEYIRIKENARASLYSLIVHHIIKGELEEAIKYAEAVAIFDESHYNHFAWLGYLYREKRENAKAKINFEKAINICKRDSKWKETEVGKKTISTLESKFNELPKK
ncbi:hypothetical protein DRO38_08150 [Candidatus Bathyarchaeota archaeon]|nr:MAG: hypothetical protein DRO38_08150 [Candidatus Bathyarchaeota archaeon]